MFVGCRRPTDSDKNTSHFEIYSSNNAIDWFHIGSVNASGNNTLGENSKGISFEPVKLMKIN
jgi:hypothetical protein